jgi:hypothetical protein
MLADALAFFSPASPDARLAASVHQSRRAAHVRMSAHGTECPERARVEEFIRAVYREHYDARLSILAPTLVALRSGDEILAAAGYRSATERLFLERYLDAPVEVCLARSARDAPDRPAIVEVGHLAAARNGAGRLLMPLLGAHLAAAGFEWVVSTATEELRHLFRRLGLSPLVLGSADPSVLGADAGNWGSYYDHRPHVVAGSIASGMSQLTRARI